MKNIKIIEVPSEIGAGTRGASLGIEAIKIAALDFMSNFFIHFPSERIPVENKLLYEPIESPYAKRIKGVVSMYEKVSKSIHDTIKSGFFPVVLSGDHSIAGATIAGIKMAKPKSKLGSSGLMLIVTFTHLILRLRAICTACRYRFLLMKTIRNVPCMKWMQKRLSNGTI